MNCASCGVSCHSLCVAAPAQRKPPLDLPRPPSAPPVVSRGGGSYAYGTGPSSPRIAALAAPKERTYSLLPQCCMLRVAVSQCCMLVRLVSQAGLDGRCLLVPVELRTTSSPACPCGCAALVPVATSLRCRASSVYRANSDCT